MYKAVCLDTSICLRQLQGNLIGESGQVFHHDRCEIGRDMFDNFIMLWHMISELSIFQLWYNQFVFKLLVSTHALFGSMERA